MFTSRNKGQDIRKCIYWFETFERNVSWGQVLCPHTSALCYSICLEYLTSIFQMLSRCLNPSDPFLDLTDIIISYADGSSGKESTCKAKHAGDLGSIPGLGRSPAGGNGNPLQYSCQGNCTARGAWGTAVHGTAKNRTQLSTCWWWWHATPVEPTYLYCGYEVEQKQCNTVIKNLNSGTKLSLNLSSTSCVTMTKLFNFLLPQFPLS